MAKNFTTASSGNVANGTASASLAASPSFINYITGFHITGAGATSGQPVQVTVTGVVGGTMTFVYAANTGPTANNNPLAIVFPDPVAATGANVAITVSCPALGAGNTNNAVVLYGFRVDVSGSLTQS